jgi:hypothetical protein
MLARADSLGQRVPYWMLHSKERQPSTEQAMCSAMVDTT